MKILTLALFSGTALAFFTSWSNSSSVGGGGSIGLHQFNGTETEPPNESKSESRSKFESKSESGSLNQLVTIPETKTTIVTKPPVTVTGFTTFCPSSTLLTITTCKHHKCAPTTITVTEPSTVTITEECLIQNPQSASVDLHHFPPPVTRTSEFTVTELVTFCPEPTVFTYTRCVHGKCGPAVRTVTRATTITIWETCIVVRTFTEAATITPEVALHTHRDHHTDHLAVLRTVTKFVESTVTDFVTVCPSPTVFTVTRLIHLVQTLSAVTVTEATTITIFGACIIPVTVTGVITMTATPGEAGAFAIAVTEATVTDFTTFISTATVLIVTTCTTGKCVPSPVTVTEATTLIIPGTLVIATTITEMVDITETTPEAGVFVVTVVETTVTELETFVPQSSTLTITTCIGHICAPILLTITSATTITLSGHLVVPLTVTHEVVPISTNTENEVEITELTATELSTVISEPTVLTVTTCAGTSCVATLLTVSQPTTLVLPGTFVVHSPEAAIFNGGASGESQEIAPSTPVNNILSPTEVPTSAPLTSVSEIHGLSSVSGSSTPPAVTLFDNHAARNLAGFLGVLGFAALLV